ncbi:polysaccharide lyase [Vibrio ziniensis]|uniref:Polysaccharide lyase n=1 Tax=Vibrio ziniensis TaxID=2711221 RepID=A0A6G7CHV6_9VIBR|nr:polysaccharide lyase [Vibrio ziniensis]QIH41626.1 hypothetical protein G5S32_06350 [Vibrio ziniensis]
MQKALLFILLLLSGCVNYGIPELQCPSNDVKKSPQYYRFSDLSQINDWGHHYSYPYSAQIVSDPMDDSNKVLRVEIREGDTYRTYTGERHRAEIYEAYKANFNQLTHYSFRVLIPDEWQFVDVRSLIAQWHATPDRHLGEISRSPNLGIELRNDRFVIRGQASQVPVNTDNKKGMQRKTHYVSEPIKRNFWYQFDVVVNWSYEENGVIQISINSEPVVNFNGATSYYDCIGPYFKMGIYRDDTPKTFVIYFDDYQRNIL